MHYLRGSAHKAPQADFFGPLGVAPTIVHLLSNPAKEAPQANFFFGLSGVGSTIVRYIRASAHRAPQAVFFVSIFGSRFYHCALSRGVSPQGAAGGFFGPLGVAPTIALLLSNPANMAPHVFFFLWLSGVGSTIVRYIRGSAHRAPQADFFFFGYGSRAYHCALSQ